MKYQRNAKSNQVLDHKDWKSTRLKQLLAKKVNNAGAKKTERRVAKVKLPTKIEN